jgi:hypothetical protein
VERCKLDASASGWGSLVGCCEPSGSVKDREFLDWVTVSFSGRTQLHGVSLWRSKRHKETVADWAAKLSVLCPVAFISCWTSFTLQSLYDVLLRKQVRNTNKRNERRNVSVVETTKQKSMHQYRNVAVSSSGDKLFSPILHDGAEYRTVDCRVYAASNETSTISWTVRIRKEAVIGYFTLHYWHFCPKWLNTITNKLSQWSR